MIFRFVRAFHLENLFGIGLSVSTRPFQTYFSGFEKVGAIRQIFGEQTEHVLQNLQVELTWLGGYMWVNESNGHLMIYIHYLKTGAKRDIYLDVIHELVHIRQLMEGKKLFDDAYRYVERPTEIEAYRHTVEEAKKLGMSDDRICEYLKTEWMSHEDLTQLADSLDIDCP